MPPVEPPVKLSTGRLPILAKNKQLKENVVQCGQVKEGHKPEHQSLSSVSHETQEKLSVAKDMNESSEFSKKGRDAEIAQRGA